MRQSARQSSRTPRSRCQGGRAGIRRCHERLERVQQAERDRLLFWTGSAHVSVWSSASTPRGPISAPCSGFDDQPYVRAYSVTLRRSRPKEVGRVITGFTPVARDSPCPRVNWRNIRPRPGGRPLEPTRTLPRVRPSPPRECARPPPRTGTAERFLATGRVVCQNAQDVPLSSGTAASHRVSR